MVYFINILSFNKDSLSYVQSQKIKNFALCIFIMCFLRSFY